MFLLEDDDFVIEIEFRGMLQIPFAGVSAVFKKMVVQETTLLQIVQQNLLLGPIGI
jgi:siderophore synthetase component